MNYRQWKKKYKKEHGYNPPLKDDKRQQKKLAKYITANIDVQKICRIGKKLGQALTEFAKSASILIKSTAEAIADISSEFIKKRNDDK